MPDQEFDPTAILEVLHRHQVQFVVIGGYGAALHGSTRPTEDVDITPETSTENLQRLVDAVQELRGRIRAAELPEGVPFDIAAEDLATRSMLNLMTDYGAIDVSVIPGGTTGYPDLTRAAHPTEVREGVVIELADLRDIIRSKRAASRPKDLQALPDLEALADGLDQGLTPNQVRMRRGREAAFPQPTSTAAETTGATAETQLDPRERAAEYLRRKQADKDRGALGAMAGEAATGRSR